MWGASEAIREQSGIRLPDMIPVMMNYSAAVAHAEQEAEQATFHAVWAEGRSMLLEQAITFALDERSDVRVPSEADVDHQD